MERASLSRSIAVLLVSLTGLLAVGNGVYLLAGDHPFDGANDYSHEIGMTKSDAAFAAPETAEWVLHASDLVGSASLGWGLFVVALAVGGLHAGVPFARNALWIGALPTLATNALVTWSRSGDVRALVAVTSLALFAAGMLLSYVPGNRQDTERARRA